MPPRARPWQRPLVLAAAIVIASATLAVALADDEAEPTDCGEGAAPEPTVSFINDVQAVFDFNCVFCHQTGAENAGLNLEYGAAYERLVNVPSSESELPRIAPGDAARSYLLHKVRGTHQTVGGVGTPMPPGGPLPERDLAVLVAWVLECALEN
jgi:mono/diheme cytochrome c family protein